jgi:lipopolysaccharide/colanic/teichoic acid biosynthesis glycosyltransferase
VEDNTRVGRIFADCGAKNYWNRNNIPFFEMDTLMARESSEDRPILVGSVEDSANTPVPAGYCTGRTKRVLDLVIAFLGLLALVIVFVPVGIAIKLTSRGTILFHQKRLGMDGVEFAVIKFRTMNTDAERDGRAIWAEIKDPRFTLIGGLLRRLYIDEIPQFWNVFKGEMSVVGPRPERLQIVEMLSGHGVDYWSRTSIRPGITGIAQLIDGYAFDVHRARNKVRLDLVYLEHASLWLDVKIILGTFVHVSKINGR